MLEALVQYSSKAMPGMFLITMPVISIPSRGGSCTRLNSHPAMRAKTTRMIRTKTVPLGATAMLPNIDKQVAQRVITTKDKVRSRPTRPWGGHRIEWYSRSFFEG